MEYIFGIKINEIWEGGLNVSPTFSWNDPYAGLHLKELLLENEWTPKIRSVQIGSC